MSLGLCFTSLQAYEYSHAAFGFTSGIFPRPSSWRPASTASTSSSAPIFLAVCLFRAIKGQFTPDHHFGFEAAAWYWHFVDVVWLFLFICVYWWGGSGATLRVDEPAPHNR